MSRLSEIVQFRVAPGTLDAVEATARAEGKKPSEVMREAIAFRIRAAQAPTEREAA